MACFGQKMKKHVRICGLEFNQDYPTPQVMPSARKSFFRRKSIAQSLPDTSEKSTGLQRKKRDEKKDRQE